MLPPPPKPATRLNRDDPGRGPASADRGGPRCIGGPRLQSVTSYSNIQQHSHPSSVTLLCDQAKNLKNLTHAQHGRISSSTNHPPRPALRYLFPPPSSPSSSSFFSTLSPHNTKSNRAKQSRHPRPNSSRSHAASASTRSPTTSRTASPPGRRPRRANRCASSSPARASRGWASRLCGSTRSIAGMRWMT